MAAPTQKIITAKNQLLNPGATSTPKVLRTSANLQQLLSQGTSSGQKIILNQAAGGGQRFIISTPNQSVQQTVQAQKTIMQPQQQIIINQASPQHITKQYVNSTDQQQQLLVGGQRIVLNPGQRIITQTPQQPQQQIIQQIQQPQMVRTIQAVQQQPQQQQQQIILNGNLAQQLSQGTLQVANINDQQVTSTYCLLDSSHSLINFIVVYHQVIVKPIGNNQVQIVAHLKTQSDGQSHIVTNQQMATKIEPQTIQQQVMQSTPMQQKIILQSSVNQAAIQPAQAIMTSPPQAQQNVPPTMEQLLQGQPPGTQIKCVTAQVVQMPTGPRIVLQGIQGSDLTPQQLALVNQQVKQQLMKGEYTFSLVFDPEMK